MVKRRGGGDLQPQRATYGARPALSSALLESAPAFSPRLCNSSLSGWSSRRRDPGTCCDSHAPEPRAGFCNRARICSCDPRRAEVWRVSLGASRSEVIRAVNPYRLARARSGAKRSGSPAHQGRRDLAAPVKDAEHRHGVALRAREDKIRRNDADAHVASKLGAASANRRLLAQKREQAEQSPAIFGGDALPGFAG